MILITNAAQQWWNWVENWPIIPPAPQVFDHVADHIKNVQLFQT